MDLIAIATRGRTDVARLVLGSVADKVLRGSHTAVLLIHSLDVPNSGRDDVALLRSTTDAGWNG